jgi:hypothetical protein
MGGLLTLSENPWEICSLGITLKTHPSTLTSYQVRPQQVGRDAETHNHAREENPQEQHSRQQRPTQEQRIW